MAGTQKKEASLWTVPFPGDNSHGFLYSFLLWSPLFLPSMPSALLGHFLDSSLRLLPCDLRELGCPRSLRPREKALFPEGIASGPGSCVRGLGSPHRDDLRLCLEGPGFSVAQECDPAALPVSLVSVIPRGLPEPWQDPMLPSPWRSRQLSL